MALHRGFPTVAHEGDDGLHTAVILGEVQARNGERAADVQIAVHEDSQNVLGFQLPVVVVRHGLALVTQMLTHLGRQNVAIGLFQKVADAALAGLGVDPDDISIVSPTDVLRIHGQVGNRPAVEVLFFPPLHPLGNGILMGAGESGEDQRARVGAALIDVHPGAVLIGLADGGHIGEVQLRVHAVGVHIHCQSDDIHVAGALAVAEQGALHPVGACQQGQFGIRHAGAPVVVGVQGECHVLPVLEVLAHVLHLAGVDVGHAHFHGDREVDDDVVVRAGFQHIEDCVADLQSVFGFGAGEAFGGVFKPEIALIFRCQFLDQLRALHGDLLDLLLTLAEDLLPLGHGHGVVEVDDGVGGTLAGIEGLADDVLPALGQHLHGHIFRNHVVLNQGAQKLVFGFGGGGEAYLDLFEADAKQHMVEFQLLFQAHGDHQALVAVP